MLMVLSAAVLESHTPVREPDTARRPSQKAATNPRRLQAMQLLERRRVGVAPRVRFEWDAVAGARRYELTGRWTSPPSWAVQSANHRVTAQNATVWEAHRVGIELPIAEGTHSWSVVALFGPDEHGDFARPASVSFDVR
jgi:hypothetical protein